MSVFANYLINDVHMDSCADLENVIPQSLKWDGGLKVVKFNDLTILFHA